uniref:Integrin alpha-2-like n=1 Tax=Phallusia mammillata TaxID=59560 RepID=A0A6F9DFX2_9ASCI|nr:integrin alpha-2-like [Phallusia mammillata]
MVVITDGAAVDSPGDAAEIARERGIIIAAIGVGRANSNELKDIANGGVSDERVFNVKDYSSLNKVLLSLQKIINDTAVTLEDNVGGLNNDLVNCISGTATHITKNRDLHVGAVNAFNSFGSIVSYSAKIFDISLNYSKYLRTDDFAKYLSAGDGTEFMESYIGYSISSGQFYGDGQTFIITGAPRFKAKGIVYGYVSNSAINNQSFSLHPTDNLWQLGAYYGQSILALDLNNDNFDDLLISAPLYSNQGGYDQGRVFVYMNDPTSSGPNKWNNVTYRPQILKGSNVLQSRFGFSMSNAGDVDLDGYSDVIIGSPGEETTPTTSGAVYIYFGSPDGLHESKKQKIVGYTLGSSLKNFGAYVFGGYDFDENGYKDVLVGAPPSSKVVLMKSRPIIDVTSKIVMETNVVNIISCVENQADVCIQFKVCVNISRRDGKLFEQDWELESTLSVDAKKSKQKRFNIIGENAHVSKFSSIYNSTKKQCFVFGLQLEAGTVNNPFSFDFTFPATLEHIYDLKDSVKQQHLSPLLSTLKSDSVDINFDLGCKEPLTTLCTSDISSSVKSLTNKSTVVVDPSHQIFALEVTIINMGYDPAYFVHFNITSLLVQYIKMESSCAEVSHQNTTLGVTTFRVLSKSVYKHYMKSGTTCTALLYFDMSPLLVESKASEFNISGIVYTSQENTSADPNIENNKFFFTQNVQYEVELNIYGSGDTLIFFNESISTYDQKNIPIVYHNYTVRNFGPSTLYKGQLTIQWPETTESGHKIALLDHISCQPESNCICALRNTTAPDTSQTLVQINLPFLYNCSDVLCAQTQCEIRHLQPHYHITVNAAFKPWFSVYLSLSGFRVFSSLSLDVYKYPVINKNERTHFTLSTSIQRSKPNDYVAPEELNVGHIIGGILGGIAALAAIIAVMWKFGFFESKYAKLKQEMQMRADAEERPQNENIIVNE